MPRVIIVFIKENNQEVPMPNRKTSEQIAKKLQDSRSELLDRLELTERVWSEMQERQIEYEERATNDALSVPLADLSDQDVRELLRIDKALSKIAENTYGFCESCGRPISPVRLKLLPEAEWCVECAARLESSSVLESAEEEGPVVLPEELDGLEDGELASRIYDAIRYARIVDTEELEITCIHGIVRLHGYLPSEKEHRVLLQYLADTLGITTLEDHLLDDRILWENKGRTPEPGTEPPNLYDILAEGAGEPAPDVTEAQTSGLPMDAPDEFIAENETRRTP